ncbi:histone H1 [Rhodoflexus sp.]
MNRFNEIKQLVDSIEADFAKFYEQNNQAAGTRVRKAMLDLKNLAQSIRQNVQEIKKEKEKEAKAK